MNRAEIERLYDRGYVRSYNEKFLLSDLTRPDAEFEVGLLSGFLAGGACWLDVACGTGHFLSKFPDVQRAGLDVSPAMLDVARHNNPEVTFRHGDFRDGVPEWKDRWGLVSCMWYAYGLVDSLREVRTVMANLADWTAPEGTCFVPFADPHQITGIDLPYQVPTPYPGETRVDAVIWSYIEDGGENRHAHMIAPHLEVMTEMIGAHFAHVEVVQYPIAHPGWEDRRAAIVARGKKQR